MEATSKSSSDDSRALEDGRTEQQTVSPQEVRCDESSALSTSLNVNSDVNPVIPTDVDTLMARLMAQLSTHEREEVYNDLHGVADEVVETPEMIDEAMTRMKGELASMSTDATAYREALAQDRSFVHSYKSLLCFLRAERFDPVRAATRLTKFYSLKMKGFGLEKLTKEIY